MVDAPRRTNWRRGFFRIWIVISALWSAGVAEVFTYERLVHSARYFPPDDPLYLPLIALAPWLLTIVVLSIAWIAKGFKPD
jgi:hypothetical protein